MTELKSWEDDPALYLFTSLTAGSSHVVTATSRIETILKNARIPFSYVDTATDESAKKLYQRRGKGKKLPLLVKEGFVIGDLQEVEEWNEFGELKEAIGDVPTTSSSVTTTPAITPSKQATESTPPSGSATAAAAAARGSPGTTKSDKDDNTTTTTTTTASTSPIPFALRQAAFETALAAKQLKQTPINANTTSTANTAAATATSGVVPPLHRDLSSGSGVSTTSSSSLAKQFVPEHFDPMPMTHRGSSVSLASEEEIKQIECSEAIPEENEDEEEEEEQQQQQVRKVGGGHVVAKAADTDAPATKEDGEKLAEELEKVHVADEKKDE